MNKQNAIAFYLMAYEGNPRRAVERYVGDKYIQHNPLVGDGKEPFIPIKPGREMMNTSPWISFDLMKTGK